MDLSVVIVSFNTKDKLRKCLRSIFDSRAKYAYQVWVVDNASRDGSADMVASEFPDAKLIRNDHNQGFARANNTALRLILKPSDSSTSPLTPPLARGGGNASRYILLLNSDIVVMPDTLEKMIGYMDENPDVGISGCRVEKPDGSLDLASRRSFPSPTNAFFRLTGLSLLFPKSRVASYNLTYLPENETTEVDSVMGAFLLIRRDLIDKIGLLDENFFMYGEDLDWCYRARAVGAKVMFVPITKVTHDKGSSSRKVPSQMIYEFHRSMMIFYDKYYRRRYNFLINFLVTIGIWMRYLVKLTENALRREKYVSK